MKKSRALIAVMLFVAGCSPEESAGPATGDQLPARPDIIATNAFYYYSDLEAAWNFYNETLGLETVVDYGFAKIMRLAESSYLTLVQASEGMHSADEPKTVTLSLVTDELNRWYEYLAESDVEMRAGLIDTDGQVSNSFVVVDPEGYYLKFVRYNPHPGHEAYVGAFSEAEPVVSAIDFANGRMSIRAAAFSAYFENLQTIRPFYEGLFDVTPSGKLNNEDIYQMSGSGFLQLVEGGDELHRPTDKNGVTLSFLTTDVDAWFERATEWPGFELRTPEIFAEGGGLVRVFVGYDPDGIFLEWDTFADGPENEGLSKYLR